MWISGPDLARSPGHRFYEKLNELLSEAKFDRRVEELCAPYFEADDKPGRPSIAPGVYFRMLFVGYFEGIESERGLEWRCADSLSLRTFLGRAGDRAGAGPLEPFEDAHAPRWRGLRRGVPSGAGDRGVQGASAGQGRGRRFDVPACRRLDEEHRAQGHGRRLHDVPEEALRGPGHRESDGGGRAPNGSRRARARRFPTRIGSRRRTRTHASCGSRTAARDSVTRPSTSWTWTRARWSPPRCTAASEADTATLRPSLEAARDERGCCPRGVDPRRR